MRHRSPEQSSIAVLILAVVLAGVFVLTVIAAVGVIRDSPGQTVSVAQVDLPATAAVPPTAISAPAVSHAKPVSDSPAVHVPAAHHVVHVIAHRAVRHHHVSHRHHHNKHHGHHRHC